MNTDRRYRVRGNEAVADPRLGRVEPKDFTHLEKYPMTMAAFGALAEPQPVGIGVNWYRAFYADQLIQRKNGRHTEWWVKEGDLGPLMGGHALALEPFSGPYRDTASGSWWYWHNQISEGICVSEMCARLAALYNRKRFQPRPLYDIAQTLDEWAGEDYSGTSVNAGLAVMRGYGMIPAKQGEQHHVTKGQVTRPFNLEYGIVENRWAMSDDEVFATLGDSNAEAAVWLNSWGQRDYPHRVHVPRSVISRLRAENGEFGIVTDRP